MFYCDNNNFYKNKNVYLRVNHGEWLVKPLGELTEYERILIRSLQPGCNTNFVAEKMPVEE